MNEQRAPMKITVTGANEVVIENAVLWYKNFAGIRRPGSYDTAGDRNFTLIVTDQSIAQTMIDMGYNMKYVVPEAASGTIITPYWKLKVHVRFASYPKNYFVYCNGVQTRLTEETIGQLDRARLSNVDVAIGLGQVNTNGSATRTAYLNRIDATMPFDYLGQKYSGYGG